MAGTWKPIENQPTFNADTMLLLTDGTVMCHELFAPNWHQLTADSAGDYETSGATWSRMTPMAADPNKTIIPTSKGGPTYAPLYFASAVMGDGTVFVAGGEDNKGIRNADLTEVQIYNPVEVTWTRIKPPTYGTPPVAWDQIGDAPSCVLADGRLLLGSIDSTRTAFFQPETQTFSPGPVKGDIASEESWVLLRDGTVLAVQCTNVGHAEKYVPSSNTWVPAQSPPVTLTQLCAGPTAEIGAAILLTNGHVFAIGANGNTAIYIPPGTPSGPGTWKVGPTIQDAQGQTMYPMDAPAVLLPNGKVLLSASPAPPCSYPGPTQFFEYDPTTNKLSGIDPPDNSSRPCFTGRFLLLPNGKVLFSNGTNDIAVYTPDGAPQPAWRPTITSCPTVMYQGVTYMIYGTNLNGLSQACGYGDDAQMATNYPIVQVTSLTTGVVSYLRTFGHSTMAVGTGGTVVSTHVVALYDSVTFPGGSFADDFSLVVIANGIASDPVQVSIGIGKTSPVKGPGPVMVV